MNFDGGEGGGPGGGSGDDDDDNDYDDDCRAHFPVWRRATHEILQPVIYIMSKQTSAD